MIDPGPHRTSFTCALSPEECADRLAKRCSSSTQRWISGVSWHIDPDRPLFGSVTRHGFSVFLQATYRNTFQTRALGRFLREDGWTRVDVHFGMDPVAGLFPKIWVGALLAMLIFFLCVPGMLASAPAGVWFILAPIFMMPFGPAMQVYGRWVARDEERKLRELLPRILESTENPTA